MGVDYSRDAGALARTLARPQPLPFDHPALVTVDGVEVVVEGGARVAALPLADGVWLVP